MVKALAKAKRSTSRAIGSGGSGSMKALVDELVALLDARARIDNAADPDSLKAFLPVVRPPATAAEIAALQKKLGVPLPTSYREFLQICDGIENFAGTHLLLGARDHGSKKIKAAIDDIAEFWEDEDGDPVEIGVPVAVPDADMGIRNFWAFAHEASGAERRVVDWDNGDAAPMHASFRALLEWSIALEKRLNKKSASKPEPKPRPTPKPKPKLQPKPKPTPKPTPTPTPTPTPKPTAMYKVVRRPLGKLALPRALDRLATFVGKHPHGSLGWFSGVRIDRLAGPAAKALPATLKDSAITFLELSEGARVVALATGATPIVLVDADGTSRLLAPNLAAFVLAWASGKSGVPDVDHDGEWLLEVRKGNHAVYAAAVPSARKALAAWAKAEKLAPARGESFDLAKFLGGAGSATTVAAGDSRRLPHDAKLEAPLVAGKATDFARYGAWLTQQGHPLGAVITADAAAEKKPALKNSAFKTFDAYVKAHLAPRYSRIAASMAHFTRPDLGTGMSFQYGFLRKASTSSATPPMREQLLDFLANDDHARWLIRLGLRDVKLTDLSLLEKFPALRTVNVTGLELGAKALAPLATLHQLRALRLTSTGVSDLAPLAKLPLLQLYLDKTAVVDLRPLKGHPTLEHLELDNTEVRDITPLLSCKKLCNVGLYNTHVSKADAEKLIATIKKNGARPISDQDDIISGYYRYVGHKEADWNATK